MRRLLVLPVAVLVAAISVPLALATAPIAAAASTTLDAVTVTGEPGAKPTVTSDWPLRVKKSVSEVRTEGSGASAAKGDRLTIDYVILNGRTGEELDTSYGGLPVAVDLAKGTTPALLDALVGTTVGSRVLVAVAPKDGLTRNGQSVGLKKNDTILFVVDVKDVSPLRATGTPVAPVAGLPEVSLGANGAPKITIPDTKPPADLVAQPLIVGDGPAVQAGQVVEVQYTGALWRNGKVFDSTWRQGGRPVQFPIGVGQVIAGWDDGLVGQTVGSQVLLVIPPDQGYGDAGQPAAGIKGDDTLVFVVDILGAVDQP